MSKESFAKGAAILSLSGLIVKILGAVYRIPLTSLIGTEGMANYNIAYGVYNLLLAISLAGLPTAIARLISEKRALNNYRGAYQVYSISLVTLFIIGMVSSLLVLLFARPLVNLLHFPNAYHSMIALVPALLIIPVMSSYRGFFQGAQNMAPLAISQFMEQLLRVIVGYGLAYTLVKSGVEKAAAGATFGASVGSIGALSVILLFFIKRKKLTQREINSSDSNLLEEPMEIVKKLLIIAVPITIGAAMSPLMSILDSYFVGNRLGALGYTQAQIEDLMGQLGGMAQSLINFPQAFSTAIAVSLVPALTEAYVKKDKIRLGQTSDMGVKLSLMIALPSGVGMFMLAQPIMLLLYPSMGEQQIAGSSVLLQIQAIGIIFFILNQAYTAMLQSVNKQILPVKNLFFGLIIKVILSYILIGIAPINIKGAAISSGIAYFVTTALNLKDIRKYTRIKMSNIVKIVSLPLLSTALMAIAVWIVFSLAKIVIKSNGLLTLLSIAAGGLVYVAALFFTGAITREDLEFIPMGSKLKRFVRK
jgi:stage V sporulation protein B